MARGKGPRVTAKWDFLPEADKIARELIEHPDDDTHRHLKDAHIVCLSRPKAQRKPGGDVVVATIRLAKKSEKLLAERHGMKVDYIITAGLDVWNPMGWKEKEITIFHELAHAIGRDERDQWAIRRHHDVEEFESVVRRYGAYRPNLTRFFKTGAQLELPVPIAS